jgi:hypothetical protein
MSAPAPPKSYDSFFWRDENRDRSLIQRDDVGYAVVEGRILYKVVKQIVKGSLTRDF